jgi:hypothetical protein|nr:MAG TPA: Protein of unknown function (DUF1697) [Caudoviricetes sp.]
MGSFNTFGKTEKSYGSGKSIWHEIKGAFPVGGKITNLSDFAEGSVIPSGSMCVFDQAKAEIKIAKATDIKTATNTGGTVDPKTVKGLLQNDIYKEAGVDYATGNVVFAGEIYIDRLAEAVPDEVLAVLPMIVPIKEK